MRRAPLQGFQLLTIILTPYNEGLGYGKRIAARY